MRPRRGPADEGAVVEAAVRVVVRVGRGEGEVVVLAAAIAAAEQEQASAADKAGDKGGKREHLHVPAPLAVGGPLEGDGGAQRLARNDAHLPTAVALRRSGERGEDV